MGAEVGVGIEVGRFPSKTNLVLVPVGSGLFPSKTNLVLVPVGNGLMSTGDSVLRKSR
jgi:hypothetical protein